MKGIPPTHLILTSPMRYGEPSSAPGTLFWSDRQDARSPDRFGGVLTFAGENSRPLAGWRSGKLASQVLLVIKTLDVCHMG
jgi:hypothetical protein